MNVHHIGIGFVGAGVLIGMGIFLAGRQGSVAQAEISAMHAAQVFSTLAPNENAVLDYKTTRIITCACYQLGLCQNRKKQFAY